MKQQSESKVAFSYTRFSTIDQKKGDSARRQLEAAKEWCQKNGYILSEQRFLDEGKWIQGEEHHRRRWLETVHWLDWIRQNPKRFGSYPRILWPSFTAQTKSICCPLFTNYKQRCWNGVHHDGWQTVVHRGWNQWQDALVLHFIFRGGQDVNQQIQIKQSPLRVSKLSSWSNWRKRLSETDAEFIITFGGLAEINGSFLADIPNFGKAILETPYLYREGLSAQTNTTMSVFQKTS